MNCTNQLVEVAQIAFQGTTIIGMLNGETHPFDMKVHNIRLSFSSTSCLFTIETIDQFSPDLTGLQSFPMDLDGSQKLGTYSFQVKEEAAFGESIVGIGTVVIEDIGILPKLPGEVSYLYNLTDNFVELTVSDSPGQTLFLRYNLQKANSDFKLQVNTHPK